MVYTKKPKKILHTSKQVALGILESVATLALLCATYTRRASQKLVRKTIASRNNNHIIGIKRRTSRGGGGGGGDKDETMTKDFGEESFGDGGLWRRSILMGDKCEPLAFSGVIYYDANGKLLSEPPAKSPRASPFAGYTYRTTQNY